MKKTFYFVTLAVLSSMLMASCNKQETLPDGYGRVQLKLMPSGTELQTKAANTTLTAAEKLISNYVIGIFNSSGELVNSIPSSGVVSANASQTVTAEAIQLPYGSYTAYAFVNLDGALSKAASIDQIKAVSLDLPTYNSTTDLAQVGSLDFTLSSSEKTATKTIEVRRLVARATLGSITNKVPEAYGDMTVEGFYFMNVVGNQNAFGTEDPSTWYNQYGQVSVPGWNFVTESTSTKPCYSKFTSNNVIANAASKSFTEANSIYTYPNTSEVKMSYDGTGSFSACATYVCVVVTFANDPQGSGTRRLIPIRVNKYIDGAGSGTPLQANCAYTISSLTISNLPYSEKDFEDGKVNLDEDQLDSRGAFTATINVDKWTNGGDTSYTY